MTRSVHACHAAALLGTATARLCAHLTMVLWVSRALGAARLANVCTEATDVVREVASTRHGRGGETANRPTIKVETNALRHHLDVAFF